MCGHQSFQNEASVMAPHRLCTKYNDAIKGSRTYFDTQRIDSLKSNVYISNNLICNKAKYGAMTEAREIFEELLERDVVSWTSIIQGYVNHGCPEDALGCFSRMQNECSLPNVVTFVCVSKACSRQEAIQKGKSIHAVIVAENCIALNSVLGNALVDMYAKCGSLAEVREAFNILYVRNTVSWTVLIAGFTRLGYGQEAIKCFLQMQHEGFLPNHITFSCILKAYGRLLLLQKGKELHVYFSKYGLLNTNTVLGTALVDMYVKCRELVKAKEVFNKIQIKNLVSWTVLMTGYAEYGYGTEALKCFERMQSQGLLPDIVTFSCILKACGMARADVKGKEIHTVINSIELLEKRCLIGNALLYMYHKCGAIKKAKKVFDELPLQNIVSWNALLTGYVENSLGEEALDCYERMQTRGIPPDDVTYLCILKACSFLQTLEKGNEICVEIFREGRIERNNAIGNSMIAIHAKCGSHLRAQQIFEKLPVQDVVSWNTLISGYVVHSFYEEAILSFENMQKLGVSPDGVTFLCVLKACRNLTATEKGQEIFADVLRIGLTQEDPVLGAALVYTYAKCGTPCLAKEVFSQLPVKNVIAWNALITGYAQLGNQGAVFELLQTMMREGIEPDVVTFTLVLKVCSYAGLVEKGEEYFEMMKTKFGRIPTSNHWACMVDILGRAGKLDMAIRTMGNLLQERHLPMWSVLLDACGRWGSMNLGRQVFERIIRNQNV